MKTLIASVASSHHRDLPVQSEHHCLLYCLLGGSLKRQSLMSPKGKPEPLHISEVSFFIVFLESKF